LSLSDQALSLGLASTSTNGALSSTDWNTFNNKQNALTNPITGTGTAGQVSFWNGANTQGGKAGFTFNDSTNLLTLLGGITLTGAQTIQTSTGNLTLATGAGNGNIILSPHGTGKVGIGTTNPESKLHLYANDTGTLPQLTIEQAGTGDAGLRLLAGGNAWSVGLDNSAGDIFSIQNVGYGVDSGYKFSIKQTGEVIIPGNVGIGTATPNSKLQVTGNVAIGYTSPAPTNGLIVNGNVGIGTSSPDANLTVNGAASFAAGTAAAPSIARAGDLNTGIFFPDADTIAFAEGGAEAMRIDSVGKILIPSNRQLQITSTKDIKGLQLLGRDDDTSIIGTMSAQALVIRTNSAERMRITSAGNVLIGTTIDSGQRLQVNGNQYISGELYIGTTNVVAEHKVRISGGAINVTNWPTSIGAYDKLSIDFGEFRGIGYDPDYNEVYFAGTTTVPVKIDTDAPTDSLTINPDGNVSIGSQIHTPVQSKGNSGTGTVTFNWNDSNIQTVTLTGNCTFAFSNPQSGASYQIVITQDATGSRTITWPSGIYWENKTAPLLTGVANSVDVVTLVYDGAKYIGLTAKNFGTP
jgi:hypothetical protein